MSHLFKPSKLELSVVSHVEYIFHNIFVLFKEFLPLASLSVVIKRNHSNKNQIV
jgi:hypothetical protein